MTGTIESLASATALFVFGHFILSSIPVRNGIKNAIGDIGFQIVYTAVAAGALVWTIMAYGAAPYQPVWNPPPGLRHVTYLILLAAIFFAVIGLSTRSPTAVGGEKIAADPKPVTGILTITRHPFLVGAALWAVGHLLVNGDLASIILFGGILLLSVLGMLHIDYRRRRALGAAWGPIALSTSVIPFQAALSGRTAIDWAGIGWGRFAAALVAYGAVIFFHDYIAGVALIR